MKSAQTTGIVMLIIGASTAMSWVMTITNAPQEIARALMFFGENEFVLLLLINLLLLVVGMFMDMTPAVLIFTPILLPIVKELGMSEIHFGIMMIANLSIGLCTPPVGTCLFVGCGVGNAKMTTLAPKMVPYFLAMLAAQILITYVPWISEGIPELLGM